MEFQSVSLPIELVQQHILPLVVENDREEVEKIKLVSKKWRELLHLWQELPEKNKKFFETIVKSSSLPLKTLAQTKEIIFLDDFYLNFQGGQLTCLSFDESTSVQLAISVHNNAQIKVVDNNTFVTIEKVVPIKTTPFGIKAPVKNHTCKIWTVTSKEPIAVFNNYDGKLFFSSHSKIFYSINEGIEIFFIKSKESKYYAIDLKHIQILNYGFSRSHLFLYAKTSENKHQLIVLNCLDGSISKIDNVELFQSGHFKVIHAIGKKNHLVPLIREKELVAYNLETNQIQPLTEQKEIVQKQKKEKIVKLETHPLKVEEDFSPLRSGYGSLLVFFDGTSTKLKNISFYNLKTEKNLKLSEIIQDKKNPLFKYLKKTCKAVKVSPTSVIIQTKDTIILLNHQGEYIDVIKDKSIEFIKTGIIVLVDPNDQYHFYSLISNKFLPIDLMDKAEYRVEINSRSIVFFPTLLSENKDVKYFHQ